VDTFHESVGLSNQGNPKGVHLRTGTVGLGVDIEEVGRFKKLIRNKRFLDKVYTRQEVVYCNSKKNRVQHFAVRFAAKEAVWKALSEAIRRSTSAIRHRDIGVKNAESGKPEVTLPKSLARWAKKVTISLSHTRSYAVAVALVRN